MPEIRPKGGVNLRLKAYDTPENQFFLMQNVDMTHQEVFEQIKGSVRYHGDTIGTNAPTGIFVNYNDNEDKQDVLVCVDDKIMKKNFGANEFTELLTGLTPGVIKQAANLRDKTYFANPKDGFFEYDGISVVKRLITNTSGESILLKDIIIAKETNRAFGITANNELVWTDDLADMGGVPIRWAAINVDTQPPARGDVPEKLMIMNGRLVILRTNSIWVYYIIGSPSNWRPEQMSFQGGCVAPQTVKKVGDELWFLGYSPENEIGVYAFDGSKVRLISYDVEPFLRRINPAKVKDACAEHVDNLYKLSVAIDASMENDYTLHFDTINVNKDTGSPCIYGPHTYGFSASVALSSTKFKGEHLFARKHTDGARVFKVADYRTQYSTEMQDDGSLIPTVLMTGLRTEEEYKGSKLDVSWFKKYSNLYVDTPNEGSWSFDIEVLKGYENEAFLTYQQYMEGENYPLEAIDLDSDPADFESSTDQMHLVDLVSDSVQFRLSNYNVNQKMSFRSIRYDVEPDRRKKHAKIVSI